MSSTCLNCQTKSAEIITPSLDDDKFFRMESGSKNSGFLETFLKRRSLKALIPNPSPRGGRESKISFYIIWIFGKELNLVSEREQFWIDTIKIPVNTSFFERSTARKIDFFSFPKSFEFLFRKPNPFGFRFVGYHTRAYKNSFFSLKNRTFCPAIREVFIGFATEDFVFHRDNRVLNFKYREYKELFHFRKFFSKKRQ